MDRKVIIAALVFAILLVCGLGGFLAYTIATRSSGQQTMVAEQVKPRQALARDIFAGREQDAINMVRNFKVLNPEYIDALMESKKTGKAPDVEYSKVTIDSLVEQQFLEKRFKMTFLQKGEWRALHLDTDMGDKQTPDPQYEVYLDYHDESVVIGPVWIVDVETGNVIARNDMASIFDRDVYNYDLVEENLKRPEAVIKAITSHRFDVGIDLGGVFLLYFLKQSMDPKHANDQIIGWTVMQEFKDEFSAYFQWKDMGETRVAKFRFNWATKSLEPKGLLAIDLMRIGENMEHVSPVNIYPGDYTNNLHIPRVERWTRGHACRSKENHELCTAFVKVLEQQEFISALAWLLTNGEPNATRRVEQCKTDRKCYWNPRKASGELNPENRDDLIEISYIYELNHREHSVRFLVDSKTETVTPLDKISQWAYWSVTPRT